MSELIEKNLQGIVTRALLHFSAGAANTDTGIDYDIVECAQYIITECEKQFFERARAVSDKSLEALLLNKNDYTSTKRLVDIPATDYNKVINTAREIVRQALREEFK